MRLLVHLASLSFLLYLHVIVSRAELSDDDITDLRSQIHDKIFTDDGGSLRLIGGLTRLSFHDCVGESCDGCINVDYVENAGLEVYIDVMEEMYNSATTLSGQSLVTVMSRADFWALSGAEAIQYASENSICNRPDCTRPNEIHPPITFRQGRVDCATSPYTDVILSFPDALWSNTSTITDYFRDMFGFSTVDVVAILGAHTLGLAHRDASGFRFPWTERQKTFNNQYYIDMLNADLDWVSVNVAGARDPIFQWTSSGLVRANDPNIPVTTMMLNADMALIKHQTGVTEDGEVTGCTYTTCADLTDDVGTWSKEFAVNNTLFLEKFASAYERMIQHGYSVNDNSMLEVISGGSSPGGDSGNTGDSGNGGDSDDSGDNRDGEDNRNGGNDTTTQNKSSSRCAITLYYLLVGTWALLNY